MFSRLMLTINFNFLFNTFILFAIQSKCTEATNVEDAFKNSNIVLFSKPPKQVVNVKFGNVGVFLGTKLSQSQVFRAPTLTWKYDPDSLYTLAMIGFSTAQSPSVESFIQWLVVDISGDDVDSGETIITYVSDPDKVPAKIAVAIYAQKTPSLDEQIEEIETQEINEFIENLINLLSAEVSFAGNYYVITV